MNHCFSGRAKKTTNTKNKTNVAAASECVDDAGHTEGMSFLATARTQCAVNQSRTRNHQNKSKVHLPKSQFESIYHPKEIYRYILNVFV